MDDRAYKTVWIVEVLSREKFSDDTPLMSVIEGVIRGDHAGAVTVIEGGHFTGHDEVHKALEYMDVKGDFEADREPEVNEDADPGEDSDPGEDADPPEDSDPPEDEDPPEDDGNAEESHVDHPKYPERPGMDLGDMPVCMTCFDMEKDNLEAGTPFMAGTAYRCDLCEQDYVQPVMVIDPEAS